MHPQPRMQNEKQSIRVSHHRFTGTTRHSPRNGLRLLRALPGDRACLPPSSANDASTNLTPASGSQNDTTWPSAFATVRYRRYQRPPHPAPRSVTIAKRPSGGTRRGDEGYSPRIFLCQALFRKFGIRKAARPGPARESGPAVAPTSHGHFRDGAKARETIGEGSRTTVRHFSGRKT